MAVVRLLKDWMKDPEIGKRIVPIAPDEYRTFGMDAMFPSAKVYNPGGQQYESVDRKMLLSYKESAQGQMLHEGISEAGAMASATAAGSAYSTHGEHMIPFYIFYSMFGFQRTGDSIWAMADQLARGFLIGATAGRTTLTGEGLQHADGHSPLLAATNPAVVHYDPAFAYEVSHIMQSGLERMYGEDAENVIFYLTVYNEPVAQPAEPEDVDVEGILKGIHHVVVRRGRGPARAAARLRRRLPVGQGGARILAEEWGVQADTWSVTSWNELARDAVAAEEWNLLHPGESPRTAYVTDKLSGAEGPVVAVSDYMRAVPLQIARWVPGGLPGARRRRVRLRRHPPGRAALLPHRRPVGGRADAPGPRRRRPDRAAQGRGGLRAATGSTTRPPSPASSRRAATPDVSRVERDARQGRSRPGRRSRAATRRRVAARRARRCRDGAAEPAPAWPFLSSARNRARLYVAGCGRADEVVHDLGEAVRVVLVREVPGVGDHLDPGARRERGGVAGVPHRDHPVVAAPDDPHRHLLGEVGPVGHRDDLAAPVDDGAHDVPDRVPGVRVLEGVEDRRRPRRGRGSTSSGRAESARSPAMPTCRTPGSVSTPITWWKPGVVIARIAGDTSGPRPPEATSISRSVRSGNW